MFVIVSYDIPDDKRRTRVMKMLRGYGAHVQESVFECDLEPATFRQMRKRLKEMINQEKDNVRLYHLCQSDVERVEGIGVGREVQRVGNYKIVS